MSSLFCMLSFEFFREHIFVSSCLEFASERVFQFCRLSEGQTSDILSTMVEYYQILGVQRNASPEDIKKA